MLGIIAEDAQGVTLLYFRPLDSLAAHAVLGTEGAGRPFGSPDGMSVAFVAEGKLKRVEVAGGSPLALCDVENLRGGTRSEEGVILFSPKSSGLQRVLATGGSVSAVTQLNQGTGESAYYYPQFLPGGKEFLYLNRNRDGTQSWISVGSLEGKPSVRLVQSTYRAIYSAATGHLLFIQKDGTLMAQRVDLGPYRLAGTPVAVAEQVGLSPSNAFADFSISYGSSCPF